MAGFPESPAHRSADQLKVSSWISGDPWNQTSPKLESQCAIRAPLLQPGGSARFLGTKTGCSEPAVSLLPTSSSVASSVGSTFSVRQTSSLVLTKPPPSGPLLSPHIAHSHPTRLPSPASDPLCYLSLCAIPPSLCLPVVPLSVSTLQVGLGVAPFRAWVPAHTPLPR